MIKESEIKGMGKAVTYITTYHAVGFGYYNFNDRQIYKSGGNGFYYPVDCLLRVIYDGGREYRETVNELNLAETYKN